MSDEAVSETEVAFVEVEGQGSEERERRKLLGAVFALAVLVPLLFTWFTGQIWEDFFITFRHARNWALGDGLVYHVGERVHGFTSPLNVGLLAIFDRLFGAPESYLPALWAYRVVNILSFASGATVLADLLRRRGASTRTVLLFACLYVLQIAGVAYTINGQEAGFLLLALALAFTAAHDGIGARWKLGGIGWAALLWSRPDGCILIAICALVGLLMRTESVREQVRGIVKATLVCTALYLPWFAGAWIYYGTPVPHTITAKMNMGAQLGSSMEILQAVLERVFTAGARCFTPIYAHAGGWPQWVLGLGLLLSLLAGTLWLWPVRDRLLRMASLAFVLHASYLAFALVKAHLMPWYTPPTALLGILAVSLAAPDLATRLKAERNRRLWSWLPTALLVMLFALVFSSSAAQLKVQQEIIEHGTRTQVGLFLADVVGEGETVYLEPLGYIGYFSGKTMLDYPGLASPRTVAARELAGDDMFDVIPVLDPDFLAFRLIDYRNAMEQRPDVMAGYEQIRVFDSTTAVEQHDVQGKPFLWGDAIFVILKRKN